MAALQENYPRPGNRLFAVLVLGAWGWSAIHLAAEAQTIEIFGASHDFEDGGRLLRTAELTPSPDELLITPNDHGEDIELDVAGGKIYFVEETGGAVTIRRANLDGTSPQTIVSGLFGMTPIALDLVNGKIYFGDDVGGRIRRANLDGSAAEDVVTGVAEPSDIAIDHVNNKIYYGEVEGGTVHRANLDGSNAELFDSGTATLGPFSIAVDPVTASVYWSDAIIGITRIGYNSTDFGVIVEPGDQDTNIPFDLAIDSAAGKLYFSDFANYFAIRRIDLDGSFHESVHIPPASSTHLALDTTNDFLYWTEAGSPNGGGGLRRKSLPLVNTIRSSGLLSAGGLAVSGDQLYYVDTNINDFVPNTGSIHRSNLDGTGDVTLLPNLFVPYAIAIDATGGKMYWSDFIEGVRRANLNGSSPEIIVGSTNPAAIALDLTNDKVYWIHVGANPQGIRRANLDGTNAEQIIDGVFPSGVDVHPGIGKVYWTETGGSSAGVYRANLDGSNPEPLVLAPDFEFGQSIKVDTVSGKIYWMDIGLMRANLDGSNIEVVQNQGAFRAVEIGLRMQNLATVYVDFAFAGSESGTESSPFNSVQEALSVVLTGGTIILAGDSTDTESSETPTISQMVTLDSTGGTVRIGDSD